MALFLYNVGIRLFGLLIRLVARWNPKARQWTDGRKGIFTRLQTTFAHTTEPVAWFHCASLGEFEQARPVIENLNSTDGFRYKILLTFFSPSGYQMRKAYEHADWVFYLPLDTRANARQFLDITQPAVVFFAKYEFWQHYLSEMRRQNIPAILFSAIFRPDQVFFKPYGQFFRNMLACFRHIFVQNEASADLLRSIGLVNVTVAGDTRIDRVCTILQTKKDIPLADVFKNGQLLLVVGSPWPGDLDVVLPLLKQFNAPLKIIIAPHEIREDTLQYIEKTLRKSIIRYSAASEATVSTYQVLLIDNVGLLSSLYQYAEFAYIGGGFSDGIHNILEPTVFGMPVFFGPNYHKFQEASDLIALGAAFSISNTDEFLPVFEEVYHNEPKRQHLAGIARTYIQKNTGATDTVLEMTRTLLLLQ